jgi:hypothetical protein
MQSSQRGITEELGVTITRPSLVTMEAVHLHGIAIKNQGLFEPRLNKSLPQSYLLFTPGRSDILTFPFRFRVGSRSS